MEFDIAKVEDKWGKGFLERELIEVEAPKPADKPHFDWSLNYAYMGECSRLARKQNWVDISAAYRRARVWNLNPIKLTDY